MIVRSNKPSWFKAKPDNKKVNFTEFEVNIHFYYLNRPLLLCYQLFEFSNVQYEFESLSNRTFFKKFTGWFMLNKWLAVGLVNIATLLILISAGIGLLLLINNNGKKKTIFSFIGFY
jgi:hypothetical protein